MRVESPKIGDMNSTIKNTDQQNTYYLEKQIEKSREYSKDDSKDTDRPENENDYQPSHPKEKFKKLAISDSNQDSHDYMSPTFHGTKPLLGH